ncbi:thiamine diphosphokinase [Anaerocolumna xylanovorans]|uniref:Thiamine diphosphokinase n=1 Tax=Anaerocolumna xylanovorans DSM 12503 TaxID=1121345 RepID=A0A1M7YBK0_9FIRM|nr:thiamine diphosphokinase [Anaerocolumna xylanovorans]SHO49971.1 thiamine pyrophosphokinase [Anaerocolumna xylanovorans DSM 12503]
MNGIKVLIVTGGKVSLAFMKEYLDKKAFDKIIAVDKGLEAVQALSLKPDYIIGDFDSVSKDVIEYYKGLEGVKVAEYDPMKDATDTELGILAAMELKPEEIVILGATGNRADHMIANVSLLYLPLRENIKTSLVDDHNKIYLINHDTVLYRGKLHGPYVSLLPFTEIVKGVTLKGFLYPLQKKTLTLGSSLGVSNEVTEESAEILMESGILLVIEAKD